MRDGVKAVEHELARAACTAQHTVWKYGCHMSIANASVLLLLIAAAAVRTASAQSSVELPGEWKTGEEIYASACASCHGIDGQGQPRVQVGFEVPLPDFTDCSFVTREPDTDWSTIAHWGGPARAFDKLMPAFGAALTGSEIQRSLDHIRGFCTDDSWPRGELNFPRALVTEKAFPEDEAVLSVGVTTESPVELSGKIVFETRFGALNQFELIVPFGLAEPGADAVGGDSLREGIGDVALGIKRVLVHSLETGTIFAAAGEVILPTGDEADGFGTGTLIVEPFLSAGQLIPAVGFVQLQAGMALPIDPDRAAREVFGRVAAGRSFRLGRFNRLIAPMVELLAARKLESGATIEWDLVPQVQVALSTRQHVLWCAGVRVPLSEPDGRALEIMTYLLWDWYDGGLFEGW